MWRGYFALVLLRYRSPLFRHVNHGRGIHKAVTETMTNYKVKFNQSMNLETLFFLLFTKIFPEKINFFTIIVLRQGPAL